MMSELRAAHLMTQDRNQPAVGIAYTMLALVLAWQ
jgi:hypothetical protein